MDVSWFFKSVQNVAVVFLPPSKVIIWSGSTCIFILQTFCIHDQLITVAHQEHVDANVSACLPLLDNNERRRSQAICVHEVERRFEKPQRRCPLRDLLHSARRPFIRTRGTPGACWGEGSVFSLFSRNLCCLSRHAATIGFYHKIFARRCQWRCGNLPACSADVLKWHRRVKVAPASKLKFKINKIWTVCL